MKNMTDKVLNNDVSIAGEIVSDFEYSHNVFGEKFYLVKVSVSRLSESRDILPVMVSERLINVNENYIGTFVHVLGQFRSHNLLNSEDSKKRLVLSVFAREFILTEKEAVGNSLTNRISLEGYVCKPPVYRKTPLGREIADVLLAVNRPYGKSDYIPCILWGRNARFAESFEVGARIQISDGRIQSREYQKKLSDTEFESRIAYEVSAGNVMLLEE